MRRSVTAEAIGTGLLLVLIVGSGIAAGDLTRVDALFAHAVVVGVGLAALIAVFQPASGAHFNPAVTLVMFQRRSIDGRTAIAYVVAQIAGGGAGVVSANVMFSVDPLQVSDTVRGGTGVLFSETIATAVLVLVIAVLVDAGRANLVAPAVGGWILAAIVATSSTAFANPAVAITRTLADGPTGIAPSSAPGFVLAQLIGAAVGGAAAYAVRAQKEGAMT